MLISSFCANSYPSNFAFSEEEIEKFANNMLEFALKESPSEDFSVDYDYELEIMICDNDFIHNINRDYRKKDNPTDVITFALYFDTEEKVIIENNISLGQIIISADKVFEQAKSNNVSVKYELLNLLAHGILHLIGFTHDDDDALERMLILQAKMIESVENV